MSQFQQLLKRSSDIHEKTPLSVVRNEVQRAINQFRASHVEYEPLTHIERIAIKREQREFKRNRTTETFKNARKALLKELTSHSTPNWGGASLKFND
jgi:hypothetical protein